jgi:hypothetical protein
MIDDVDVNNHKDVFKICAVHERPEPGAECWLRFRTVVVVHISGRYVGLYSIRDSRHAC